MTLPTPGAAPQETRSYLLALHTPPVDDATAPGATGESAR
jgi:hypothetical protein